LKALVAFYDKSITALAYLASAAVVAILIMILIDVLTRTLGIKIPPYTIAASEALLVYMTMFSAPYLVRTRGHVHIGVIMDALPKRPRRQLELAIYVAVILVSLISAWLSLDLFVRACQSGIVDVRGIDLPIWVLLLPCPIGFTLIAIEFGRFLVGGENYFSSSNEESRL
jgi:C4-dicarboxylate transporter, DctQ subunit